MTKLTLIGLDGAGFHLLDDWISEGILPTLSDYIEEGQKQSLRSPYPPVTCPSWRCFSTGVNPGKHGVFWWEQVNRDSNSFSVPSSTDFDSPDVWEYLSEAGYESAIINLPTTYPPEPMNGSLICGTGRVEGDHYTYPEELQTTLEEEFDYEIFIPGSSSEIKNNPERVQQVLELIDKRFEVAEYLRNEYNLDFLSLTIFYTNVFHHFFWDDEITKRVWKRIDQNLGDFIKDDENLMIISDHGSNQIHNVFNINSWLQQEGYLVTQSDTISDRLSATGLTRDRLVRFAERLNLKNTVKRALPREIIDLIPRSDGTVVGSGKADKIDWEASTAIASGQGPLYVLAEDENERYQISSEIKRKIENLNTPSGTPVARQVLHAEEAYSGSYVRDGPDLIIDQADNLHIPGALGASSVFDQPNHWKAENHRDGIFIARGPDVDCKGELSQQPTIYEITPSILHWFGLPVPSNIDGEVLTELFQSNSEPGQREVEITDSELDSDSTKSRDLDQEQARERLQDLGYLSR